MRITVCELGDEPDELAHDWGQLAAHVRDAASELVLLPEMAFYPWFAWRRHADPAIWYAAVKAHDAWLARLPELGPVVVLGTRPANVAGRRVNEGFVWDAQGGYRPAHHKYYLPDEEGFWEASWYERGAGDFAPVPCGALLAGFMICTELWFFERARAYGRQGVHAIVNPRATEKATIDKWLVAGRAAAVVSGAYGLSSNRINTTGRPANLGGQGWIVGPDGQVLGLTSRAQPFLTLDLDLAEAEHAKQTYPRYVQD